MINKIKNKETLEEKEVKDEIISLIQIIRSERRRSEFLLFLECLSSEITKTELEALYFILLHLSKEKAKPFYSLTDIYNHILKEHFKQDPTSFLYPRLLKKDKKFFFNKGSDGKQGRPTKNKGVLNKLCTQYHNRSILIETFNNPKNNEVKKTHKHTIIDVNEESFPTKFDLENHNKSLNWSKEELLEALAVYLNKVNTQEWIGTTIIQPYYYSDRKELENLEEKSLEELRKKLEYEINIFTVNFLDVNIKRLNQLINYKTGGKKNEI